MTTDEQIKKILLNYLKLVEKEVNQGLLDFKNVPYQFSTIIESYCKLCEAEVKKNSSHNEQSES